MLKVLYNDKQVYETLLVFSSTINLINPQLTNGKKLRTEVRQKKTYINT